jgi:hypothetical protein
MAQTRRRNFRQGELGFYGGGSYYIGDINTRTHFANSHPAGGIFFRYSSNYRFAFRFGLNAGEISASDAKSGEPDQIERNLSFSSKIYELHSIAEFNFVEYRIGHSRYKFTLFIFGGFGMFYFDPQGSNGSYLRDQHSEGQTSSYPRVQMSIPFGLGLKWNIGKKVGLGIEWGPRRTFTDYLDDIKGRNPETMAPIDTNGGVSTAPAPGSMRGNPSTKDWYFFYGVTLNIKLPGRRPCHKEP